jgi:tetratricopeptide (TPR) repeat protein
MLRAKKMRASKALLTAALCLLAWQPSSLAQDASLDSGKSYYEHGDYRQAVETLKTIASKEPANGEIQLLLTKSYLELHQYDEAIGSAEKAVSIDPKNSEYHQWLGEAYGAKADHASMLSAYGWARKTQKEFEIAVELDAKNFDAEQDLVEYDCTAPSIVGGGEDKAQPVMQKVMSLDAAEGHFAAAVCKAVKKDYAAADAEYAKALENKPKTADRVYDIGDYFQQRGQGEKLLEVAAAGEALAPNDPRGSYYQAVAWVVKGQNYPEAEKQLKAYLDAGLVRSGYPTKADTHYWLGRAYAAEKNTAEAKSEYQQALKLNSKHKRAQDALKQLGGQ